MFVLHRQDLGLAVPTEYLPATADETISRGEALVLSSGTLTKCGATAKPAYIAVGPKDGGLVPVVKAHEYLLFATELSADGAALHIGDAVTLAADGLRVTATTDSGVAAIASMDGTGVGDTVTVRF
jgi:hypothetical protein